MKRVILTVLITIAVMVFVPLVVLAAGLVNMSATNDPGVVETSLAQLAVGRSTAVRAPNEDNPFADDEAAIAIGQRHYADACLRCHGAPSVNADEFAHGLNPPAPSLEHAVEEFSPGELFWLTKHGIRMTGMPAFGATHNDDDIWRIVAFVQDLPNLSEEQKAFLAEGRESHHEHGSSATQEPASNHEH